LWGIFDASQGSWKVFASCYDHGRVGLPRESYYSSSLDLCMLILAASRTTATFHSIERSARYLIGSRYLNKMSISFRYEYMID
jgi:hypothetical protein